MDLAHQAHLSMGFLRQEYWNGLVSPLPNPGIEPTSPALQADPLLLSLRRLTMRNILQKRKIDDSWKPTVWHRELYYCPAVT